MNPGTEARNTATEANAKVVANELVSIFKKDYPNLKLLRHKASDDSDGWYGFKLINGETTIDVDIPGDEPSEVMLGETWKSRRLYVNGSSWLWGYAVGIIGQILQGE